MGARRKRAREEEPNCAAAEVCWMRLEPLFGRRNEQDS
jgi:hypothetical protein